MPIKYAVSGQNGLAIAVAVTTINTMLMLKVIFRLTILAKRISTSKNRRKKLTIRFTSPSTRNVSFEVEE